jgi:hypothetical protein
MTSEEVNIYTFFSTAYLYSVFIPNQGRLVGVAPRIYTNTTYLLYEVNSNTYISRPASCTRLRYKKNTIIFFGQCRVKVLKKTAIYAILKKVKNGENTDDQSHLDGKKWSGPRLSSPLPPPPLRRTTS